MSSASKFRKKAVEYEQLKQFDRAVASYVRAIEESENAKEEVDVALFNKVGDLTLRQGRVTEAVTYYERAVEHYVSNSLFDNAIALCNKILRNAPGRSNVYFTLGRICGRKGLRSDATRNFLEYATRMQQENRVEEGMRALAEVADLMPELIEVNRLVEEYASRAGINLTRKRATPAKSKAQAEPEASRLFGMSRDLVFLEVDYEQQARAKTPRAARAVANASATPLVAVEATSAAATATPGAVAPALVTPAGSSSTSTPRSSRLEDLMIFDPNESSTAHNDVLGDRAESVVDSAPILTPYVDLSAPVEALNDLELPSFGRDVPETVQVPAIDVAAADAVIADAVIVEPSVAEQPAVESSDATIENAEAVTVDVGESIAIAIDADEVETEITPLPVSLDELSVDAVAELEVANISESETDNVDDVNIFGNVQVASYTHDAVESLDTVENSTVGTMLETSTVESPAADELDALLINDDAAVVDEIDAFSAPAFELNNSFDASPIDDIPELLPPVVPEFTLPEFELSDVGMPSVDLPVIELSEMHSVDSDFLVIDAPKLDAPKLDAPKLDAPKLDAPELDAAAHELPAFDASLLELPMIDVSLLEMPIVESSLLEMPTVESSLLEMPTVEPSLLETPTPEPVAADLVEAELDETFDADNAVVESASGANVDLSAAPVVSSFDHESNYEHFDVADSTTPSIALEQQLEVAEPVKTLAGLTSEDAETTEFDEDSLIISTDDKFNVIVSDTNGASPPSLDFDAMLEVETEEPQSDTSVDIAPIAELEIEEFTPLSIEANTEHLASADALLLAIELDDEIELSPAAPFEFESAQTVASFDEELVVELPDEFDSSVELPPLVVESTNTVAPHDELDGIELDDEQVAEVPPIDAAHGLVRVVPLEGASVEALSVTADDEFIAELAEARPVTGVSNAVESIDFVADDAEDILDELFIAADVPTAVAAAEATLVASSRLAEMQDASNGDPNNSLLRRRLAEALFEAGNRDAAIRELGAALAIIELSGNLSDALDIANELVRVDSDQTVHHQKRLELSIRLGDQSRLRDAYLDFADALVRQGEELRARAVFARVLEIDPWDDRARAALGDAAPPPPPKPPVAGSDSDHVNLADWLRDDDEPASTRLRMREPDVTGDEQDDFNSLLKHFKEGVARSLGEDDYASHYDLGVAYKEMGLLDDAIAEFQMALRSRTNRLPAYEALGQCFLEQQSYKVAVTVLSRALHEPDVQDEQRVGVLYLLGYSCEVLQRFDEARGYFQRVYATDIHFRDVAKRLAALDRTMR